jgi:hypothetical protein
MALPRDTSPEAYQVQLKLLRKITPGQKLSRVFQMSRTALDLSAAGVRRLYPNVDDHEVLMRSAARRYDRTTMIRVYGWDPDDHP